MTTENRKSITTGKAAKIVGKNSRTVRRWVDTGKLEGYKSPSNIRYVYEDALESFSNTDKTE
jgi:hypothetical protein